MYEYDYNSLQEDLARLFDRLTDAPVLDAKDFEEIAPLPVWLAYFVVEEAGFGAEAFLLSKHESLFSGGIPEFKALQIPFSQFPDALFGKYVLRYIYSEFDPSVDFMYPSEDFIVWNNETGTVAWEFLVDYLLRMPDLIGDDVQYAEFADRLFLHAAHSKAFLFSQWKHGRRIRTPEDYAAVLMNTRSKPFPMALLLFHNPELRDAYLAVLLQSGALDGNPKDAVSKSRPILAVMPPEQFKLPEDAVERLNDLLQITVPSSIGFHAKKFRRAVAAGHHRLARDVFVMLGNFIHNLRDVLDVPITLPKTKHDSDLFVIRAAMRDDYMDVADYVTRFTTYAQLYHMET